VLLQKETNSPFFTDMLSCTARLWWKSSRSIRRVLSPTVAPPISPR